MTSPFLPLNITVCNCLFASSSGVTSLIPVLVASIKQLYEILGFSLNLAVKTQTPQLRVTIEPHSDTLAIVSSLTDQVKFVFDSPI